MGIVASSHAGLQRTAAHDVVSGEGRVSRALHEYAGAQLYER